jgi:phage shock protein A
MAALMLPDTWFTAACFPQLDVYQGNLKLKTKQLRSMGEELEMYKLQVNEFRGDIERYSKEIEALKSRWVKAKRQEAIAQMPREEHFKPHSMSVDASPFILQ